MYNKTQKITYKRKEGDMALNKKISPDGELSNEEIEAILEKWRKSPEYERVKLLADRAFKPLMKAAEESMRISDEVLNTTINAR